MTLIADDMCIIERLLGREPRGLEDVAVRDSQGIPVVIRVSSLVDNKPFPTLFWLIDKRLNYAIDQAEAKGLIAQFQQQVDGDVTLQRRINKDHRAHIALRLHYIVNSATVERMQHLGYEDVLSTRGIGGISDFQRIRCLHTFYAAHLVCPNTIGSMLDSYWQDQGIQFSHLI